MSDGESASNIGEFDRENKDIRFSFDDEDYLLAVRAGDLDAQEMVDEAAKAVGYVNDSDWRMAHKAPNAEYDVPIFQTDVLYGNDGSPRSVRQERHADLHTLGSSVRRTEFVVPYKPPTVITNRSPQKRIIWQGEKLQELFT